jgi:glutamate-1-semialdehyde 2,1-aminomutase
MFCMFFTDKNVQNFKDAVSSDTSLFSEYFSLMLKEGIYIAPSQYEAGFISTAHSKEDLDRTLTAFEKAVNNLKEV